MSSTGPAWAEIHYTNITGTYTYVSEINAQNDITVNPSDKPSATVGGGIDTFSYRESFGVDDNSVPFTYSASSQARVTIQGVSAAQQVGAVDANTGELLDVATADSSGQITFDELNSGSHDVTLVTSDGGPSLSNPSPSDETLRYETVTLSIDLADPDFPSENVTLEWSVDGTVENTTYATSGGTKTATVTLPDGQYDWTVTATDAYGQTITSAQSTFTINHYNPEVSNVQPSGDLDSEPTQISADIADEDFGNDGDEIDVTISLDGSQIHTETITSAQTVTTSMPSSGQTGGSHTVSVEVTDSYGQTSSGTST
jgi:hypothetical protein